MAASNVNSRFDVEQQIIQCQKKIDILKGLGLVNLIGKYKGEIALLKIKLNTIINQSKDE